MRIVLLSIGFGCLLSGNVRGQATLEVITETGEKKEVIVHDDPLKLPAHSILINPFNVITSGASVLGYDLQYTYRKSPKYTYRTKVSGGYFSGVDSYTNAPVIDASSFFNYSIGGGNKIKEERTPVDYKNGQSTDTVYFIMFPRKKRRNLNLSAGLNYWKYNSSFKLWNTIDGSSDLTHVGSDLNSVGLSLGLEFETSKSYKATIDNTSRSYYRISRGYFNLSYAVYNQYRIYEVSYLDPNVHTSYTDKTDEISGLEVKKLGVKLGYEYIHGFKNRAFAVNFGVEAGLIPHYTLDIGDGLFHESESAMFSLHVGILLGSRPW